MEDTTKQAKKKALHLLEIMDRTEAGLRQKLKEKGFSQEDIDSAIDYVAAFGYLNDERYAQQYLLSHMDRKSKKELRMAMYQKGLSRELVDRTFEEYYDDAAERESIERIAQKKRYEPESATDKDKKKLFDYFIRKGYSYENVRQVLQVSSWNA